MRNEGKSRRSPQKQQQQQPEGSPYPAVRAKITNIHDQLSYQEAEQQYSKKMTYAEELQRQVQEKKRKEALEKQKQEQEDLAQERRIKEEIENERLVAEEKKKQGEPLGGGKVRFSPQVKTRKEATKMKAREPSQYG